MESYPKLKALSKILGSVNLPLTMFILLSIKSLILGTSWEEVASLLVVSAVFVAYKLIEFKKAKVLGDELEAMRSRVNMVEQVVNQAGIANIVRNTNVQENGKKRYF